MAAETPPDELPFRQRGTTQEKLDEQFAADRTAATRVTGTPEPPSDTEVVHGIAPSPEKDELDDAKRQLAEARLRLRELARAEERQQRVKKIGAGLALQGQKMARGARGALVTLAAGAKVGVASLARTAEGLGSAVASGTRAVAALPIVARMGILAGVVVVSALIVWPLTQRTPERDAAKEIEVSPLPVLPVVVPTGVLVVNAIPWAEVVSIRSSEGPEELPEEPYTPLRLKLPEGAVVIRLTHPSLDEPVVLDTTVVAGTTIVAVPPPIETLSARQYFNRLGW